MLFGFQYKTLPIRGMEQHKEDELEKLEIAKKSGLPKNYIDQLESNFHWAARALDDEWKPRHLIRWKNTVLKQLTNEMNIKQKEAWKAIRIFNESVNLREACRQYLESYFERCIPVTPNTSRNSGDEDNSFIQLPPCKCIWSTGVQPTAAQITAFNAQIPRHFFAYMKMDQD